MTSLCSHPHPWYNQFFRKLSRCVLMLHMLDLSYVDLASCQFANNIDQSIGVGI